MERFGQIELRRVKDFNGQEEKDKLELVKWNNKFESCFVIALFDWNSNEHFWEMTSVGLRYLTEREDGWEEYVLAALEVFRLCNYFDDDY